jgi:hypothetical protein
VNDGVIDATTRRPGIGGWFVVLLACSVVGLDLVLFSLLEPGCVPIGSSRHHFEDLVPWVILGAAAAVGIVGAYVIVARPRDRRLAIVCLVVALVAVVAMFVIADQRLHLC